jgi:hypothetical protein
MWLTIIILFGSVMAALWQLLSENQHSINHILQQPPGLLLNKNGRFRSGRKGTRRKKDMVQWRFFCVGALLLIGTWSIVGSICAVVRLPPDVMIYAWISAGFAWSLLVGPYRVYCLPIPSPSVRDWQGSLAIDRGPLFMEPDTVVHLFVDVGPWIWIRSTAYIINNHDPLLAL